MDQLKEAFQKVKDDISNLNSEFQTLKNYLNETRLGLVSICEIIKELSIQVNELKSQEKTSENQDNSKIASIQQQLPFQSIIPLYLPYPIPTHQPVIPTNQQISPTHPVSIPTDNLLYKAQKEEKQDTSTGNEGVPTDKQTNQQTNQQTHLEEKSSYNQELSLKEQPIISTKSTNKERDTMYNALNLLNSLDSIKKDIRNKFKRLTEQEMSVFSAIYQLEEEKQFVDYKLISNKLSLSESSIRDYVGKLIKKGIPLEKTKINNKNIQISVSSNLTKIAPLSTIIQLREL